VHDNISNDRASALSKARACLASVFGTLFPRLPVVAIVVDEHMRVVSVEGGALGALGISSGLDPGTSIVDVLAPSEAPKLRTLIEGALRGTGFRRVLHVNERFLDVSVEPLRSPPGDVQGAVALCFDVTAERDAQRAVVRLEANLARAQRLAQLGWWHDDIARGQFIVSDELRRLYALPSDGSATYEDLLGRVHPEDREHVRAALGAARRDGVSCRGLDYRIVAGDGSIAWAVLQIEVTCDTSGAPIEIHGAVLDVTVRKVLEEHLRRLAHVDVLSGLANRTKLAERLDDAFFAQARVTRIALIFIDIDDFKTVNDTFGHAAGDGLLQGMAQRISECVRPDDFVARSGGDEFVVLVPMPDRDAVAALAERIVKNCARPFAIGDEISSSSISLGVSMAPEDAASPTELLRNADLAMYGAKRAGGNTYRFFAPAVATVEEVPVC